MKILIIRHGDPDYSIDSLTKKGWNEAEYLAERMEKLDIKNFYISPLGRAKDTANVTLKKMNRVGETLPWLREFHAPIIDRDTNMERLPWDFIPEKWTQVEEYYQKDLWHQSEEMKSGKVYEEAKRVQEGLDHILKEHGYVRVKNHYKVEQANTDTIVFFCHFGVECIMLGHLLGISPVVLLHGFIAAPSSVTTITTEERRKGVASFRVSSFGDISHLYAKGENPAFAGRFCERYDNFEERHD